jgi:asparagine synthase (glutamine-hydrolysing)
VAYQQRVFKEPFRKRRSKGVALSQVVGIVTADRASRGGYIEKITPQLPLRAGMTTHRWTCADAQIACALPRDAPVDSTTAESPGTFVLGRWSEAAAGAGSEARRLLDACQTEGGRVAGRGSNYGFSFYINRDGTAWIGADILGLFPIYYYADDQRLLFSTSPALLESHPAFKRELNVRGLIGNLLTMQIIGGQTLRKGVFRLKSGHALRWKAGEGAKEINADALTPSDAFFGESFEQHLERFHAAFQTAVRRDAIEGKTAQLMSGGLDSRMIAAYLRQTLKQPVHAITLGQASDLEMRVAGIAAKHLGWPQHSVGVECSQYLDWAEKHLTHLQLGCGFNDMSFWYAADVASQHATRVFNGFVGDPVMGGTHINWGFDPKRQIYRYETLFARVNQYGYTPDQIAKLVRPDVLDDSVDAVQSDLREEYESIPGLPFQKVWLFDLQNRQRFHVASGAWKVASGAWPVLPFADATMLQTAAGMPADTVLDRRAQKEQLCRRFPDLAELPFDRNRRFDTAPLRYRSSWSKQWDRRVMSVYRKLAHYRYSRKGVETRYYYRVYDINNPAWQSIRLAAEPHRKLAETIFQPEELRRIVPPPDVSIQVKDGIIDAARIKTLLGFMLWAGKNL